MAREPGVGADARQQGRSIAVVRALEDPLPIPRASDRITNVSRLGCEWMGQSFRPFHPGPRYQCSMRSGRYCWHRLVGRIDFRARSAFCHQPTLEHALDQAWPGCPNVDQFLGWEVTLSDTTHGCAM